MNKEVEQQVSDLIFEAAIMKAIQDERELLAPSIQHFLEGGKVNGQFRIALKRLMRWVEKKTLEASQEYADQQARPLVEALGNLVSYWDELFGGENMAESGEPKEVTAAKTALTNYKNKGV